MGAGESADSGLRIWRHASVSEAFLLQGASGIFLLMLWPDKFEVSKLSFGYMQVRKDHSVWTPVEIPSELFQQVITGWLRAKPK